jgi:hypothetical protein
VPEDEWASGHTDLASESPREAASRSRGTSPAGGPAANPAAELARHDPDHPLRQVAAFDSSIARCRRVARLVAASDASPAVALLLLPFAVYHRSLTPGWTIADQDLLFYIVPYHTFLVQAWQAGDWLPLWNSHIFLGAPFLANIQGAPLYPQNLLLALVSVPMAINWLVALHFGIAGCGMYLYCLKALRLRRPGSSVAALVFMFGALMFSHVGHFNLLNTLAWAPWAMLAADRAALSPTPSRLAAVSAVIALVILAGHAQAAYYAFLLAFIVAAARLWNVAIQRRLWRRSLRTLLLLSASAGLGVALAALQLTATLELASQSIRGGGLSHTAASAFSLPFRAFAGDILPDYTGEHRDEFAASVGAAALPLIALAVVVRGGRRRVLSWVVLGVVALVVAFGPKARLYDALYTLLPGFNLFRVPARALVFTTIAAAVLSGYGVRTAQQFGQAWRRPRLRPKVARAIGVTAVVAGLPAAVALLVFLAGSPQRGVLQIFPPLQLRNLALLGGFEVVAAAIVLAGIAGHRAAFGLLPAVVFVDLILLAGHTYPMNPLPEQVTEAPLATTSLVPHSLDERHLVLVSIDASFRPASAMPAGLSPMDQARYEWFLRQEEAQAPNVSLVEGTHDADGYDGGVLPLRSYVNFRAELLPPDSANQADFMTRLLTQRVQNIDWLTAAGVTTVVTVAGNNPNPPGSSRLVPVGRVGDLVAWRVSEPSPARAHLENGLAAHVASDTGERVVVQLPEGASGRLILADAYYPGWTATVDGHAVPIERYVGYVRAVSLPPGARVVVFEYQPRWLVPAALVNGAALFLMLTLALVSPLRALRRVLWRQTARTADFS